MIRNEKRYIIGKLLEIADCPFKLCFMAVGVVCGL